MNDSKRDELFYARLADLTTQCNRQNTPAFSLFLDERQIWLAEHWLRKNCNADYVFSGGYPGARRQMLGVLPGYIQPDEAVFPICPLTFHFPQDAVLSHRDFLGSLMAFGIRREFVGDIWTDCGKAAIFLHEKQLDHVVQNIRKIGRTGVKIQPGLDGSLSFEQKFETVTGTVSSLRLDAVVAMAAGLSREKASALIESELVAVNYQPATAGKRLLQPLDVFSIRGYGKYCLEPEIRVTRKERLAITLKKYI